MFCVNFGNSRYYLIIVDISFVSLFCYLIRTKIQRFRNGPTNQCTAGGAYYISTTNKFVGFAILGFVIHLLWPAGIIVVWR